MQLLIKSSIQAIPANPLRRIFEQAEPGALNLASGHPNDAYLDFQNLREASRNASADSQSWRYGASQGDPELLDLLTDYFPTTAGTGLLITSGAQQGIDLSLRLIAKPKGILLVPEMAYPAAVSAALMNGLVVKPYKVADEDDTLADLTALLTSGQSLCALYALPTFANPTGCTMTLAQRQRLLALACEHHFPIIEDDPYRELWFHSEPPPTLYHLNAERNQPACVIYLGSFSKVIAPGLRVGWMAAPQNVLTQLVKMRQACDLQANAFAQRIVYHYLAAACLGPHLERFRAKLAAVHHRFVAPLADAGFQNLAVQGGLFVMADIGHKTTAQQLCDVLLAQQILVVPGNAFRLDEQTSRYIRLCFATLTLEGAADAGGQLNIASRGYL